jgi:hypothetical protein
MFGFVNGLANYFMSQLEQFKTVVNGSVWLSGNHVYYARFGGFN